MEFFIGKNTTLPLLKMQIVKDGRDNDFIEFMNIIEKSTIYFSMIDVESGIPKVLSESGGFVSKTFLEPNAITEYYIYYQFNKKDTNKVGRFEGQFVLISEEGKLIVPIREKLYINVFESFVSDDICCTHTPTPSSTPTPTVTPTPV
jgi:hypothetical protein